MPGFKDYTPVKKHSKSGARIDKSGFKFTELNSWQLGIVATLLFIPYMAFVVALFLAGVKILAFILGAFPLFIVGIFLLVRWIDRY